jgi:hypothetical protein
MNFWCEQQKFVAI